MGGGGGAKDRVSTNSELSHVQNDCFLYLYKPEASFISSCFALGFCPLKSGALAAR